MLTKLEWMEAVSRGFGWDHDNDSCIADKMNGNRFIVTLKRLCTLRNQCPLNSSSHPDLL